MPNGDPALVPNTCSECLIKQWRKGDGPKFLEGPTVTPLSVSRFHQFTLTQNVLHAEKKRVLILAIYALRVTATSSQKYTWLPCKVHTRMSEIKRLNIIFA